MGWLFKTYRTSLKDEIAERTKGWTYEPKDGGTITTTCLAHCWRGGRFSGNLWCVFEQVRCSPETSFDDEGNTVLGEIREVRRERFIMLFLMQYRGGWGYKDVDESMGPCEISCPMKYLDMVPDPGGYATAWRERVRQYWADRKCKFTLKVGQKIKLRDGMKPNVFTLSVVGRRTLGVSEENGGTYKIPRHKIEAILAEPLVYA